MSHLRYYPATTSPNNEGQARWKKLLDLQGALSAKIFTGLLEHYNPALPWSGDVDISNIVEDELLSSFDWVYNVQLKDTEFPSGTQFIVRMEVIFDTGENEVISAGKIIISTH